MEGVYSILVVVFGVLVRLGIPVAITIGLVVLLRRLDARWQREAGKDSIRLDVPIARNTRCWEAKGCTAEKIAVCSAYVHPETPCWQLFRSKEGVLRQGCLGCKVFRTAPVPVASGD
jgi:hypothetical protein